MPMPGQLLWTAEPRKRAPNAKVIGFMLDANFGLTDVDFHQVRDEGWKNMRSPDDLAVAALDVAPGTPVEDLEKAIQDIARKGNYKTIEVTVRKP